MAVTDHDIKISILAGAIIGFATFFVNLIMKDKPMPEILKRVGKK